MLTVRRAVTTGICALGIAAAGVPAVATAAPESAATGCHTRFYFNQTSYVYLHADAGSKRMGLAYTNETFAYKNKSKNGFLYGTDVRSGGGATGWVRYANLDSQRVCDA